MRILLAVIVIAALGWSAYWWIGQRALMRGYADWFEARRAEGWVAEASEIRVRGFPNRFDTGFTDLVLADPETGLAWEAPYFQLSALSYQPNHVIAVWPEEQRIATPKQKFRVEARDMRASLRIAPGSDMALENLTLTTEFLQVTPDSGAGEETALSALTLAAERQQDRTYRLGLSAEGLTLAPPWRDRLDPESRLPAQISGLEADLTVTFDKVWDRSAVEVARPQPTRIEVDLVDGLWGQLHLQAAGADLDGPWDLAKAHNLVVRNVGHVGLAVERQHVVLAHRVHLDVLDENHLVVGLLEEGLAQDVLRVEGVPVHQELVGPGDTLGGVGEALPVFVFAQNVEDGLNVPAEGLRGFFVVDVAPLVELRRHAVGGAVGAQPARLDLFLSH